MGEVGHLQVSINVKLIDVTLTSAARLTITIGHAGQSIRSHESLVLLSHVPARVTERFL